MKEYTRPYLQQIESEAIYVLREVAGQFDNPALLFSGGKDSIVVAWLARKAFFPAPIPFPFVHIDTGHNFPETLEYRDRFLNDLKVKLLVGSVQESIDSGRVSEETGPYASRNALQTVTLLDTIAAHRFDACIGGARRDEEKARAKERFFSHRNEAGQWDPKNQRPELWNLFNGRKKMGEHFRVFPISNWTEMDVWEYIRQESIPLPSLYFSHQREIIDRSGVLLAFSTVVQPVNGETVQRRTVRFRTIGDMTCTGAVDSTASTVDEIVLEVAAARVTERGGRFDDKRSDAAMEERKKDGYF
ncbi:MAG: sulfate adenylyltransferase [Candidatus Xenobia bacterium]|jgi:sulfate adenylyltransferase subunit 2